jgi:transcriptional regulator with XRE-family HTH domain
MEFAEKLDNFIKINYKNYAQFAKFSGIDSSRLNSYLKGRSHPKLNKLEDFYYAGVNPNWLITGQGSMFSDSEKGLQLHEAYIEKTLIKNQELQ